MLTLTMSDTGGGFDRATIGTAVVTAHRLPAARRRTEIAHLVLVEILTTSVDCQRCRYKFLSRAWHQFSQCLWHHSTVHPVMTAVASPMNIIVIRRAPHSNVARCLAAIGHSDSTIFGDSRVRDQPGDTTVGGVVYAVVHAPPGLRRVTLLSE